MDKVLAQKPPSETSVGVSVKVTAPGRGPARRPSKGKSSVLVLLLLCTDPMSKCYEVHRKKWKVAYRIIRLNLGKEEKWVGGKGGNRKVAEER